MGSFKPATFRFLVLISAAIPLFQEPAVFSQEPVIRFVSKPNLRHDVGASFWPASDGTLNDPRQLLTPLSAIDFRPDDDGDAPEDYAAESFHTSKSTDLDVLTRYWETSQYSWAPSALWHRPLYFEDVNLERHGLSFGAVQPAVSAAHFFGNLLALPYHVVQQHPHECVYTLGQCRPGNCVPFYRYHAPLSVGGGLAQAGTIVGLVLLIP